MRIKWGTGTKLVTLTSDGKWVEFEDPRCGLVWLPIEDVEVVS